MTCTCKQPSKSCHNAKQKAIGYYCKLDVAPTEPTEIGKLRYGQKFSFTQTPYAINTVIGTMDDRVQYKREDDWKQSEFDLKRIVNLVL